MCMLKQNQTKLITQHIILNSIDVFRISNISDVSTILFIFLYLKKIVPKKESQKPKLQKDNLIDTTGPSTSKAGETQAKMPTAEPRQRTEVDSGDLTEKDTEEGKLSDLV